MKRVMLSHVGRHNVEQDGAANSVAFMMERFGSKPEDILAWLSPMVGKENYPLHAFEGKGLREVIVEQLLGSGLSDKHIEVCDVDTATSTDYFSHSEYLKGNRSMDGRHAVTVTIETEAT
jgi:copper oxidase (laccase) domain-containing protein